MREALFKVFVSALTIVSVALNPLKASAEKKSSGDMTENVDCATCHTTDSFASSMGASGSGTRSATGGFDHDKTGFALRGQHKMTSCNGCHKQGQEARRDCVSCHRDFHQGRLGRTCENCHSARTWNDTFMKAIDMHRRTRFPLSGMHVLADCTQCHQRRAEREWSFPPSDCYACHQNEYNRPGLVPDHVGMAGQIPFPRDCSLCHRAAGWRPARRDMLPGRAQSALIRQDSAKHNSIFPITFGAHQGAPCSSCHLSESSPSALRCTGCHVHNPVRIIQNHKGRAVAMQGSACVSCHPGGMAR